MVPGLPTPKSRGMSRNESGEPGRVVIESVSKRFRKHTLRRKGYTTVKSTFLEKIFKSRFPRHNFVSALSNVSIDVPPGASVGLIGRNGSGKSTLLKLVSGIYRPDSGTVRVQGKISALIELGAGFHPEFTGRENIYLGGVMYGLTRRQIDSKFDAIVQYAELEDFIDDPVRTYSSGMYMRLGFSLAVHTDPDILLIDEVLAVGDAGFIHRCHETISEFRRRGKTMIFVTHDLESVARWCDEAIWLDKGVVIEQGEPRKVIASYLLAIEAKEESELAELNRGEHTGQQEQTSSDAVTAVDQAPEPDPQNGAEAEKDAKSGRWGNREVEIISVRMLNESGEAKWIFHDHEKVIVEVDYQFNQEVDELVCGVGILRADGVCVYGTNTQIENIEVPLSTVHRTNQTFRFIIERISLVDDVYFLDAAVHKNDGAPYDYHHGLYKFFVRSEHRSHGIFIPEHRWEFVGAETAGRDRQPLRQVKG